MIGEKFPSSFLAVSPRSGAQLRELTDRSRHHELTASRLLAGIPVCVFSTSCAKARCINFDHSSVPLDGRNADARHSSSFAFSSLKLTVHGR